MSSEPQPKMRRAAAPSSPAYQFAIDIPPPLIDSPQDSGRKPATNRAIPMTQSTSWGSSEVAAARAQVEPDVTDDNEQLFRTYHPSLKCALEVGITTGTDGKRVWCLEFFTEPPSHTHAGGLEIHTIPTAWPHNSMNFPRVGRNLIYRVINPRRVLSQEDIGYLVDMFPNALGAQVLIAGRINIVYGTWTSLEQDWAEGVPSIVGGLSIGFSLLDIVPSQVEEGYGGGVASTEDANRKATGYLGLALESPSGECLLTTMTHGFVHLPGDGFVARAVSMFQRVKDSLLRFRSPQTTASAAAPAGHIRTSDRSGNSSIGKDAWLVVTNRKIGTIKYSYDRPSGYLPYPEGYSSDLSLVEPRLDGRPCPILAPQPYMPMVTSWADLNAVLDGEPLFLTAQLFHLGPDAVQKTVFGSAINDEHVENILFEGERAIAEGTHYFFDHTALRTSVSLLWRMIPRDQTRAVSMGGFSGSVLCAGEPKAATAKAVVFQNFELPVRMPKINGRRGVLVDSHEYPSFNIQGGFILPKEIYESKILHHPQEGGG
ncbi:hypothetical protein AAE478_005330 [Parahypoxylon ruwenzoriense]